MKRLPSEADTRSLASWSVTADIRQSCPGTNASIERFESIVGQLPRTCREVRLASKPQTAWDFLPANGSSRCTRLVTWDRDGEAAEVYTVPQRHAYFPYFGAKREPLGLTPLGRMRNLRHTGFERRRALLRVQGWRPVIAFLALFAIVLQSLIVQTHIHNPRPAASSSLAKSGDGGASGNTDSKFPVSDETANCRLCQELAYAGRFVAPSSTPLIVPIVVAWLLIVFLHSSATPSARSYVWRSRAPPAHS